MNETTNKARCKPLRIITAIFCSLIIFISLLALFSGYWYINTYGNLGFESILYTLLSDLGGVESELLLRYILFSVAPATICTALLYLLLFVPWKKKLVLKFSPKFKIKILPMRRITAIICSIVFSVGFFCWAAGITQLFEFISYVSKESTIFEDEYIDPENTKITFPDKKRNLVYIFMESMENTFFSKEQGGALENSAIPELYNLAKKNVSFSCNDGVGGLYCGSGTNWTTGAMVAQTAGIPLKTYPGTNANNFGGNGAFLPGVKSLNDILHENGYYQTLMVGSDASFGGRKTYFEEHNVDCIYDLDSAKKDGIVEPDYNVWWGMEDSHLYRYAKQELKEISAGEQPFAFFMLTADTHHIGGYVCPYCEDTYEHQYENVYACASKQLSEFLKWIKKQDFYKNTSIVIVGDHPSMDEEYMNKININGFARCIYNCFVNSSVVPSKTRDRVAFSLDIFPTTLASMGCTIEGERLGFGTNLFSDAKTLGEKLGASYLNVELKKHSPYYSKNFLVK